MPETVPGSALHVPEIWYRLTLYLTVSTILGSIWTGVRVAEGAGLENRYTGNGIVGSNPTLSVLGPANSDQRSAANDQRRTMNDQGWPCPLADAVR